MLGKARGWIPFETLSTLCTAVFKECYDSGVQLWNLNWFHRVSFSRESSPTAWRIPKSSARYDLAVVVSRPVSIFLRVLTGFFHFGRVKANSVRAGTKPISQSAHPLEIAFRKTLDTSKGFRNAARHRAMCSSGESPRAAANPAKAPVLTAESSPDPVKGSTKESASPAR
jgi:hypothetical protein